MSDLRWSCPKCGNNIDGQFITDCQNEWIKIQERQLKRKLREVKKRKLNKKKKAPCVPKALPSVVAQEMHEE